jgi:hypothetical protein
MTKYIAIKLVKSLNDSLSNAFLLKIIVWVRFLKKLKNLLEETNKKCENFQDRVNSKKNTEWCSIEDKLANIKYFQTFFSYLSFRLYIKNKYLFNKKKNVSLRLKTVIK